MKILLIILGAIVFLLAAGCAAGGGVLLANVDSDNWFNSSDHEVTTAGAALVASIDLVEDNKPDGAGVSEDLGDSRVRIDAQATNGKQVFLGVSRADDAAAYFGRTQIDVVSDVDLKPWKLTTTPAGTDAAPLAPPASQQFWIASASGAGKQQLDWKVESGNYQLVVMNADGSPGIAIDLRIGVRIPYLRTIAWVAIGLGAFFALVGVALIVWGARRGTKATPPPEARPHEPVAAA